VLNSFLPYDNDTRIDGSQEQFPRTRWSAILAVRSDQSEARELAWEALGAAYWKPVYKYIRLKWGKSNEEAKDLTQGFFADLIEKNVLASFDPKQARFRTFLRACLNHHVANQAKFEQRVKRGGQAKIVSFDFIEAIYDREWIRSLFSLAAADLQSECEAGDKSILFRIFERYDLEVAAGAAKITYDELGSEFRLPVTTITNHLAAMRRRFRQLVLDRLRMLTASEEEYQFEVRTVFGMKHA